MFLQAQRDGACVSLFCVAIHSTDGPKASQPRPQTRNNLLQNCGGAPATTSEVLSRDGYGCSKVYGCKASLAFCVCFRIGHDFGEDNGPINAVCWCSSNISNRTMHLFFFAWILASRGSTRRHVWTRRAVASEQELGPRGPRGESMQDQVGNKGPWSGFPARSRGMPVHPLRKQMEAKAPYAY